MNMLSRLFRRNAGASASRSGAGREKCVVILGAGASKACGAPLTNEILPEALNLMDSFPDHEREQFGYNVRKFLIENFHLPEKPPYAPADFPPLPLLLSLIDKSLAESEHFSTNFDVDRMRFVRQGLEYMTFVVLERNLADVFSGRTPNPYYGLMKRLTEPDRDLTVISLNYDIIADNLLTMLRGTFPDYCCDVSTELYKLNFGFGEHVPLLKLHGSCNWVFCTECHRLDVGISRSGVGQSAMSFIKMTNELFQETSLAGRYSCQGSRCAKPGCNNFVRPVMITPTHTKDYDNPHINAVWRKAAEALSSAERAYIVGYSLPPEDVHVTYLLKRGLSHLPSDRIEIVTRDEARDIRRSEVGNRYRKLFGDKVSWHPRGFEAYSARYFPAKMPVRSSQAHSCFLV